MLNNRRTMGAAVAGGALLAGAVTIWAGLAAAHTVTVDDVAHGHYTKDGHSTGETGSGHKDPEKCTLFGGMDAPIGKNWEPYFGRRDKADAVASGHGGGFSQVLLPDFRYNCWGYAFAFVFGGRFTWVDVETVAQMNALMTAASYAAITGPKKACDVCVYFKGGAPVHVAVVSEVGKDGEPTVVQSKWGMRGLNRGHPDAVPPEGQGATMSYFRSTKK